MKFDILTIFPNIFAGILTETVLNRAIRAGHMSVNFHNFRNFADNGYVDDYPYGGSCGMVLKPEPIARCIEAIPQWKTAHKIVLSPQGHRLSHDRAHSLAQRNHLILVCGRYEGIDQRAIDLYADEEISIGDYVLSGGELAAMVLLDAVARHVPGVLGNETSAPEDTFSHGSDTYALKGPVYTRPRQFAGLEVPEVLLSGDPIKQKAWRTDVSKEKTQAIRPDLLPKETLA